MRTFIAVDFPTTITKKIDQIITYFKSQLPDRPLKWVSADNLHLTVKFIGDIPEMKVSQAKSLLRETITSQPPFSIVIEGLGMYPHPKNPRVIWLGISGGATLVSIHQKLNLAYQKMDIKPERRRYSPHLTIARVRQQTDQATIKSIGETLSQFKVDSLGKFLIDKITLYQSELTPEGPKYSALLTLSLYKV